MSPAHPATLARVRSAHPQDLSLVYRSDLGSFSSLKGGRAGQRLDAVGAAHWVNSLAAFGRANDGLLRGTLSIFPRTASLGSPPALAPHGS